MLGDHGRPSRLTDTDPHRVLVLRSRCGISVETRTDPATGAPVIARVSGDRLHPTNFGRLCTKGATHAELMAATEGRLTTALVRSGRD